MKKLLFAALAAVALSIAWNQRAPLQRLLAAPPPPPKAIQFDNGTVRQYTSPEASSSAAPAKTSSFQPGAMRKCLRGSEVQYTNIACPPGFKEAAVAGPPVTVVDGLSPKPASASPEASGRARLQGALGLSADDGSLKERIMQRAIDSQR